MILLPATVKQTSRSERRVPPPTLCICSFGRALHFGPAQTAAAHDSRTLESSAAPYPDRSGWQYLDSRSDAPVRCCPFRLRRHLYA